MLVEDDEMLGSALSRAFTNRGDTVEWVKDGERGVYSSESGTPDCVLLDVNLPRLGGMEVIKHIHKISKSSVPVLMLTAMDALEHRVKGLDLGADDYLTKPFELDELYARIRALVRRHKGSAETLLRAGDVELDVAAKTIKPDPVTPAAPFDVSSRTPISAICCPMLSGVWVAWARNTAAIVR